MKPSVAIVCLTLSLCCPDASHRAPTPSPTPVAPSPAVAPSAGPAITMRSADDLCGLEDFPVTRSTAQILALVPAAKRPSSTMVAKLRTDAEGRVTHIRVVKLAYPEAPAASGPLNETALDDLKNRRFVPPNEAGKGRPLCVDVAVTIDLR
jgi:hypothetical protein